MEAAVAGELRIETGGAAVARRGAYGVARPHCADGGRGARLEKRYASAVIGAVESGVFDYRGAAGEALAAPGAILLGNAGEEFMCRHRGRDGARRSVVTISGPLMQEAAEALGIDDDGFRLSILPPDQKSAALYGAVRRLTGSEEALDEGALELAVAALALGRRCGSQLTACSSGGRIDEVIRYVETGGGERCSLDELAALAGLSRFHFIRVFHAATGASPHQFLIATRLRRAAERLRACAEPVTRIALDAGFNDLSHFNRTFRRAYGMSPRQWRARG